jgi:hypothetical protein
MPEKLEIPQGAMGPSDKDVLAQLSTSHPIQVSESKVSEAKLQSKHPEDFKLPNSFSSPTTK